MAHEDEGQIIDIGPVVDPFDQRIVPFMGQEALAARLEGSRRARATTQRIVDRYKAAYHVER